MDRDWRDERLEQVRRLIGQADAGIVEEVKWRKPSNPDGVPVWSRSGIICTGETYKDKVKLTFARGAELPDPGGLFNASLEGNARRAIDLREADVLDEAAFVALIQAAAALNSGPRLLSGGNPQVRKGDGDGPVQAFIAAMPGWKQEVGRQLDTLVTRTVPGVKKAVKWNSPFYGVPGQGYFLSLHCYAKYVKVAFFRGSSLTPPPPVESKQPEVRYLHIGEAGLDEAQFVEWVRQAAELPGWVP